MPGNVTRCGSCGSGMMSPLFDMGVQPLAEDFTAAGPRYPLCLIQCQICGLVQLSYVVDPAQVFRPDHPYATGNSRALREHYENLARELEPLLHTGDVVVDIGANDGTFLGSFGYPEKLKLIAVEPTGQILKCGPQVDKWQNFFSYRVACDIRTSRGKAQVITACNVLAHVPDAHDFLDGVHALLADDGVLVTENHNLESITGGLQIDTIYHEHLRYYTPGTLGQVLEDHGLRVERIIQVPTHGGSFRTYARKATPDFANRARTAATALRAMLYQITEQKREEVWGISASTRAVPLIHYAGITEMIAYIAELPESDKIGKKLPGTQIPVIAEQALIDDQPQYALLLNWHMADIVVPKLRAMGYTGKFIVPLPEPKVLDD